MYKNTSQSFNDAIGKSGGRTFDARLISDTATIQDGIKKLDFSGGSNCGNEITIGSAVSAYIDVTAQKSDAMISGKEFRFEIGIKTESGIEYCPMGLFTAEKQTETGNDVKFRAYDRMSALELPYVSNLQYPCTTTDVMSEITQKTGFMFVTAIAPITLDNPDTSEGANNAVMAGYTLREAAGYIAGLYGKFAIFNRSGELEFRWYEDSGYQLPAKRCWALSREEKNFTVGKITGVSQNNERFTAGSGDERINYSNPFVTQGVVDDIYKNVGGFSYRPAEAKFLGDCRIDPWDIVTAQDITGDTYRIPAMQIRHSLDGGLATTIKATASESVGASDKYKGPITKAMERTHAELLIVNFLLAQKANFDYVEANYVQADELTAAEARIETAVLDSVSAEYATIKQLGAESARIDDLETTSLTADSAVIQDLLTGVADINTLIFGSATGTTIQTEFANAVIAQLGNAQIKSAMIEEVAASKITGLDINTNKVTVHSEDGKSVWSDNTIQISDGTRIRVQIGKDASNDYSINIWDEQGNLMFSEGGITDSAIKTAIIRNEMVSENANISAGKLDIASLFEEINNDGSHTLNSSKIYVDSEGQTLDVSFVKMKTNMEAAEGEISTIKETVTTQGTDISVIQGQISRKIWQLDITTAVSGIEIGGRNLIRNSNFSNGTSNWGAENVYMYTEEDPTYKYMLVFRGDSSSYPRDTRILNSVTNVWKAGETYTVSYYAKSTENNVIIQPSRSLSDWGGKATLTTSWKKYVTTIKSKVTVADGTLSFTIENFTATFYITNVKLEVGNKATDWTPAPEDTEKQLSAMQSQITQNAKGIESKVSKTDYNGENVVSLINQSAESVKIEAKNIDLNGVVTANENFKINEDGSMKTIAGEIGGWQITEDAIFKDVKAFVQPGWDEMERIKELALDKSWTAQELEWYDYNRDGTLNAIDILQIKRMITKIITIDDLVSQYGYVKPLFDARISLSTSDYQRALKIETNAYGRAIVRHFGLDGLESTTGVFDGALVHDLRTQVMSCEGDANFGRDLYCAGNIRVDGDLMDFSLNNSSYTFNMSGYSGHVYDIVVWGDYGCAYATIVLSLHTLSIATNGSSWTGPGSIKIQQAGGKEISFIYDGTSSEVLFHSKIVERY